LILIFIVQVILVLTQSGDRAKINYLRCSSSVHVTNSFNSLFHRGRGKARKKCQKQQEARSNKQVAKKNTSKEEPTHLNSKKATDEDGNINNKIGDCGCPLTCDQKILDGNHNSQPFSCRARINHLMERYKDDRDTACAGAAEQANSPCAGDGIACNPKKCHKQEESQSKKQQGIQENNNNKATDEDETIHNNIGDCGCPLTCDQTILDGNHNSQPFSCRTRIHHLMKRYKDDRDTACASAAEQANSPCAGDGIACNPKKCKQQGIAVSVA